MLINGDSITTPSTAISKLIPVGIIHLFFVSLLFSISIEPPNPFKSNAYLTSC